MKTCKKFEFLMSRALDDDLSKQEIKKLEAHIVACPNCMQKAKSLLVMRKAFGEKNPQDNSLALLLQTIEKQKESVFVGNVDEKESKAQTQKGMLSFPNIFSKTKRRYIPAAAIFIGVVLLFGYRGLNQNIAQKSSTQDVANQGYVAIDYPMGGILSYRANSNETNNANVEASISDLYVDNYAPELNSYFTYVGYEK